MARTDHRPTDVPLHPRWPEPISLERARAERAVAKSRAEAERYAEDCNIAALMVLLKVARKHDPGAFDRALQFLGATAAQRQQIAEDFRRMIVAREPA